MSLTIAVSKGYLWKEAIERFKGIGITFEDDLSNSRKLSTTDTSGEIELLLVRPWDVPTYVQEGAADLGITGKDVLLEQSADVLELIDLNFGACDLVIAGLEKLDASELTHNLTVATKYPKVTAEYFQKLGIKVDLIKLYGAIELAPLTGLADLISDLTATGATLKENNLHIIDTVFSSTARLIANPASLKGAYDDCLKIAKSLSA